MLCMLVRLGTWHCWILIQDARMSHEPCHENWCLAMFGNQPSMMTVDEYGWNEQLGFNTKQDLLNTVNTDVQFIFWIMNIVNFSVANGKKLDHLSSSAYCPHRICKCDKVFHPYTRLGKIGNHNSCIELHRNTLDSQIYWFKITYVVARKLFPFWFICFLGWLAYTVYFSCLFFWMKNCSCTGLYNFCPSVTLPSGIPAIWFASTWKLRNWKNSTRNSTWVKFARLLRK